MPRRILQYKRQFQYGTLLTGVTGNGGGVIIAVHGRSLSSIDFRISTMLGRRGVMRFSLGELLVNLLQVVKRTCLIPH